MTADRQERRLKNKTQPDREKTKTTRLKNSRSQSDNRPHDCGEKTKRRNNEKMSIHRERHSKIAAPAWQSGFACTNAI
jgi:hypothetical protein